MLGTAPWVGQCPLGGLPFAPADRRAVEPPNAVQIVCVGEQTRSEAIAPDGTAPIGTATVPDPGNLTRLGTILSDQLTDATAGDTALCLDSLSPLLQHSEIDTVFQFLHVLTDLVSTNSVHAHYDIDPSAHDDQATASIEQLVDAVVSVSSAGVEIKTR